MSASNNKANKGGRGYECEFTFEKGKNGLKIKNLTAQQKVIQAKYPQLNDQDVAELWEYLKLGTDSVFGIEQKFEYSDKIPQFGTLLSMMNIEAFFGANKMKYPKDYDVCLEAYLKDKEWFERLMAIEKPATGDSNKK